jgi:zinc transport system substrate-binding protein
LVYTVNYPLQYFAERVGGDLVDVRFPAPGDVDPAFWSPDAETIAAYQEADVILLNGAAYAKWVGLVTLPPSKLVDTSESFPDRYVYIESAVTHSHGPTGEHSHGEAAFTTWLDPTLAIEQAKAIREAFGSAKQLEQSQFDDGFDALERDLLALDASLRALTANVDAPLLASHPVYQYFARRYDLNLESVHFEPDELPDDKSWRGLEELLAEHPAKWMLWEGKPLPGTADRLQELGVSSVVFDPCGNRPEEGDYREVMRRNVQELGKIFQVS